MANVSVRDARAGSGSPVLEYRKRCGHRRLTRPVNFPCVLKPVSAHHWRKARNWERVGARKAICVASFEELHEEYSRIALADNRALLQEAVPGGDDHLLIAACYMDRDGNLAASFTAQKLAQVPEEFGTGCIVQTVDRPELIPLAVRLLQEMRFTGIAEVEFKWNKSAKEYQLIEVNPRPWDQHRLGHSSGIDLIWLAYHEYAGLPLPRPASGFQPCKWVAEDVFVVTCLRSLWRSDGRWRALWRLAKGRRIYGIWSAADPLPSIAYLTTTFLAGLIRKTAAHAIFSIQRRLSRKGTLQQRSVP